MDAKTARTSLQDLKRDLSRRLDAINADLSAVLDADSSERATQLENDEVLWAMRHEGEQQIAAIDAALDRLENGTYGRCARCHAPIGEDRLAAVPYTPFCVDCARSHR